MIVEFPGHIHPLLYLTSLSLVNIVVNLKFTLALTICEASAPIFVSS